MKVGSLVSLISPVDWGIAKRIYPDLIFPVMDKIYTVRGIIEKYGDTGIYLEEIINPPKPLTSGFSELSFNIKVFRELQPPMEINLEEILEEVLV